MIPPGVGAPVGAFARALEGALPGRVAGIYVVGGAALGDFSDRQSNIDLVVVLDPPAESGEAGALRRHERALAHAGRPAAVWYAGWDVIADGPTGDPAGWPDLETPLTRALLREEAVAYSGPDWPVVAFDESGYREWCRRSLQALVGRRRGSLLMRRDVSPLVLQAARLAQGAATGRVCSKSEAGDTALSLVPAHFRRILHDAAGYRNGANTSMYWGPFERKYDTAELLRHLAEAVRV